MFHFPCLPLFSPGEGGGVGAQCECSFLLLIAFWPILMVFESFGKSKNIQDVGSRVVAVFGDHNPISKSSDVIRSSYGLQRKHFLMY